MNAVDVTKALTMIALAIALVDEPVSATPKEDVRVATFNASLNRGADGALIEDLSTPDDPQIQAVAEIIQRTSPDILLINEFDFDEKGPGGRSLAGKLFQKNYLSIPHRGAIPVHYKYVYAAPSNTGIHNSTVVGTPGLDFDNNGAVEPAPGNPDYGNDAFGFGNFPGQFAFIIYSKYPIQRNRIRTFQEFLWQDMPNALLPVDPATGRSFYSPEELAIFRLSSKNHVDVPIRIGRHTLHILASHPTPPVFDGEEDRNGTRNADEIRFWRDYVAGNGSGDYIYDDRGRTGGLPSSALFVIAGDLNADPFDGDSLPGAAQQVLESPKVIARPIPKSHGATDRALAQGADNDVHAGNPANDTADFGEAPFGPGNLRVDYVLPSQGLQIVASRVFWPADELWLNRLTGLGFPFPSSDHRLVYVDVALP